MTDRSYETLVLENPAAYVLQITLNRPEVANAFNTQMATDLMHCFEKLALDQADYRCAILTGAGEKAFCAGGDLKERDGMSDAAWCAQHLVYERMIRAVIDCPVPTIAAVNGAAYGGGCELAAAVDFVYASEIARFAMTETSLGIIPGAGGTQWGLVNEVFSPDQLLHEALQTALAIAANAPIAVRQARQAIHRGLQMSLADGLAFEIEAYNRTVPTRDRREGIKAFNEKRTPDFKGE